jgi:hypothetical protein
MLRLVNDPQHRICPGFSCELGESYLGANHIFGGQYLQYPLLCSFNLFTSLLKERIERGKELPHGFGIGSQLESDPIIPSYGLAVIHLVFANGFRDSIRKSITGRKTLSIR